MLPVTILMSGRLALASSVRACSVVLPFTTTLVKPVHFLNAPLPMLVTLFGIVTLVRPVQPANTSLPMLYTLLPIVTLVRLLQS